MKPIIIQIDGRVLGDEFSVSDNGYIATFRRIFFESSCLYQINTDLYQFEDQARMLFNWFDFQDQLYYQFDHKTS